MAALFWLLATLEVVLGTGVLLSSGDSNHDLLGTNLIGFGVLTMGFAGLKSELRKARLEPARERGNTIAEQQALAAADLKRRSGMIAALDRQQIQSGSDVVNKSRPNSDEGAHPSAAHLERAVERLSREIGAVHDTGAAGVAA